MSAERDLETVRHRVAREWSRRVNAEFLKRLRKLLGHEGYLYWVTARLRRIVMAEVLREAPADPDRSPLFAHLWPKFPKKWAGGEREE